MIYDAVGDMGLGHDTRPLQTVRTREAFVDVRVLMCPEWHERHVRTLAVLAAAAAQIETAFTAVASDDELLIIDEGGDGIRKRNGCNDLEVLLLGG